MATPYEQGLFWGKVAVPVMAWFLGFKIYRWIYGTKDKREVDTFKEESIRQNKELDNIYKNKEATQNG